MTRLWKKIAAAALALTLLLAPAAQAITPDQLKVLLQEYYLNDIPQAALEAETVEDIIDALGDPYTAYMDAETFAQYEAAFSDGSLSGIGVKGVLTDEGLLLVGISENSPAEALGLTVGDLIFHVEGGEEEQTAEEIAALLRGETDTEVTFRVRHADGAEETLTARRAEITIPATTAEFTEDGVTGVISSSSFSEDSWKYFVAGTEGKDDVKVWIVDLRNNIGGNVDSAVQSVGVFLDLGTMAYLRANGDLLYRYVSMQDSTTLSPAIVLVSPTTASSAEIFGAAMKDRTAGMIIGSNTFGKGVAQVVLTGEQLPGILTDGDALRITAFQNYGVNGNTTQNIGVIPDLLVDPNHADEIAFLFSSSEPEDTGGWARLDLGGWQWYLDLSQGTAEDTAPYVGEMLSAVPPGCRVFLGTGSDWEEVTLDELAQAAGAANFEPRRFTDTEGSDCRFAADTLYTYGILQGMGDGLFRPDSSLTRAQLCALLVQAMNLPAAGSQKDFDDVSPDSWYAPYVKAAKAAGYVEGVGNNKFAPNAQVTHEQLITVLGRLAAELNLTFRSSSRNVPEETGVPAGYSSWSVPWAWLLALSQQNMLDEPLNMLYDDLENIDPKAPATRGETAQILYTILNATGVIIY